MDKQKFEVVCALCYLLLKTLATNPSTGHILISLCSLQHVSVDLVAGQAYKARFNP